MPPLTLLRPQLAQRFMFWAGALLIVAAPLIRGGNRGVALIGLEWLALVVCLGWMACWAARERSGWGTGRVRVGLLVLLGAPLWVAVWQLTPLPTDLWRLLPERAFYQAIQDSLGMSGATWRAASLTPDATWVSVLAGLPAAACLALGLSCTREQLRTLVRWWVAAAVVQAVWGLAQLGPWPWLHFGSAFTGVIGSFGNANHLASFLVMVLPLALLEARNAWQGEPGHPHSGPGAWLWGLAVFVLVLALLAGRSRAGLATGLLVGMGAALLLPSAAARPTAWRWRVAALVAAVTAGLVAVGMEGLRRFEGSVLTADASFRQQAFTATWEAAQRFWPVGSGLGSFSAVYPRFQPASSAGDYMEHAHSDYVQLLMELGVLAPVLGGLALALVLAQALQLGRRLSGGRRPSREDHTRLAAGLGLLALLLHAWVDFNWRIPALAMLGSFLFGVFMRQPDSRHRDRP